MLNHRLFTPGLTLVLCVGVNSTSVAAGMAISGKVTAKNQSLAKNSVVYLESVPGAHKPPPTPLRIDQINQTFSPSLAVIVAGTTVSFQNSDNTVHNVFSPDGETYDLGNWGKGENRQHTFSKQGVYTQLCKLHPAMLGYIVVLQNPYFAITKDDGSFEIPNVPQGDYTLAVWNPRKKASSVPVKIQSAPVSGLELLLGK